MAATMSFYDRKETGRNKNVANFAILENKKNNINCLLFQGKMKIMKSLLPPKRAARGRGELNMRHANNQAFSSFPRKGV